MGEQPETESETGPETVTVPFQDPFADPAAVPTTRPTAASLRGRLVMITPRKTEMRPSRMNPGQMEETITADVSVLDGLGPVPEVKGNPGQPTGNFLDGPDWVGVWLSGSYMVDQLRKYVGTGTPVLGVVDTKVPGTQPIKGNPWGIIAATPDQRQQAINFLNSRAIGGAAAPAPVAQQPQAAPVYAPQPAAQPQYAAPAANPFANQPAPVTQAPYAQPQAAPAAVPQTGPALPPVAAPGSASPNVNPFGPA